MEIRNQQHLFESLDAFVKGDLLEGANAYHCEKCDKKVRPKDTGGKPTRLHVYVHVLGCCRVVVTQWSERRQLRSEALGSIPSGYPYIFSFSYPDLPPVLTTNCC